MENTGSVYAQFVVARRIELPLSMVHDLCKLTIYPLPDARLSRSKLPHFNATIQYAM